MSEKGDRPKKEKGASKTPPLDITERKPMEEEMKKLSSAIEQSIDGIAIGNLEPKLTYVNHAFARMHGYSREEMIGMKVVNLHNQKQMDEYKRGMNQIKTQGSWEGEIGHIRKDGTPFPTYMSVTLLKGNDGKPRGIVTVATDITEHKQTEEELRESEEKYRHLFDDLSDAAFLADVETGLIVETNQQGTVMLGRSRDEIVGMHQSELHPPGQADKYRQKFATHIQKGHAADYDGEVIRKDGTIVPVRISASTLTIRGQRLILGLFRDITEHMQAEEELKLKAQILDGATDSIFLHDFDGNFIYVNETACRAHGYSREELMKMKLHQVIAPERVSRLDSDFQEMLEKGQVIFESAHLRKDGSIMPAEVHGRTIESGGRKLLLTVIRDITERKRAEEALRQSEERYRTLFEQKLEGVIVIDETMKVLLANQAAAEMFGLDSVEELPEVNPFDFIPSEERERVLTIIRKDMFENNLRQVNEFRLINKAGKEIWISAVGTLTEYQGKVAGLVSFRDITKRKRAEEELRKTQEQLIRSERLAAIGQLAGGVGHELRNPLGAIKNAVYYVKGKVAKSELAQKEPRVMEFLDIMDDEINTSNKIINDLLGFSRVGKPSVSPTQIEKVIEDALSRTSIPENIELSKKLDTELPQVEIDADQIQQILVNMIINAVQAMPEGGKLTIGAREGGKFLELEITDTGCGISQEVIDKIFDPLFTTRAKGIGLGLAVCKAIIDRHEGNIEVKSEVGKGTTFTTRLPLKRE